MAIEPSPYSQAPEPFLRTLRTLAETHEQVFRVSARHIESLGLTPAQFDVIATLGDTEGMTCKELSAQSLITGGTLTPVLNRMEAKGLVSRCKGAQDSRQTIVSLTSEGQALYEDTFLPFVDYMATYFGKLTPAENVELERLLGKLEGALEG